MRACSQVKSDMSGAAKYYTKAFQIGNNSALQNLEVEDVEHKPLCLQKLDAEKDAIVSRAGFAVGIQFRWVGHLLSDLVSVFSSCFVCDTLLCGTLCCRTVCCFVWCVFESLHSVRRGWAAADGWLLVALDGHYLLKLCYAAAPPALVLQIVVEAGGTIMMVTQVMCDLSGYGKSELEGGNITMLIPHPYSARHANYVTKYVQSGQSCGMLDSVKEVCMVHRVRDLTLSRYSVLLMAWHM